MKRTSIFLILFFVLGGATAWFVLNKEDDKTTLAGWDRDFAVPEVDQIHKIFLADRSGEKTTLVRKKDHWIYNGQWKAKPNAMENLLDAIGRVQMKFKPPKAAVPNMIESLSTEGIKVELYDRRDELIKVYYVGGATPDERGTFMIREGAEQPYVTHIPSWEGNLRFRYSLKGADWRDKTIFEEKLEDITEVTIEYPKQKNKSFRLIRSGSKFDITPFHDIVPEIDRPYKKGSAEAFLVGFKSLGAEGFENKNPEREEVSKQIPFTIITVKKKDGEEKSVRFHPIFPESMEMDPDTGMPVGSNSLERYYADCSNGEFMLVQDRVFRKIFWAYDFFFEE